ncbi:phosphoribosylformylglycinamidine synthase [Spirochaetia bacterium 38H-sp]|uniref:Phosphoribosylformylglycinamidine synthase n=1 Tax=Rarispira pelagica TaxID=3141764 RepID=A0ABU9UDX2_9SPIR
MISCVLVEKKPQFAVSARQLLEDIVNTLHIRGLSDLRIVNRYLIEGESQALINKAIKGIFAEPPVDVVLDALPEADRILAVELLPGQYDQRADSAAQCLRLISPDSNPIVRYSKVFLFYGNISDNDFDRIRSYLINPTDSREASLLIPETLHEAVEKPSDAVRYIEGFISADKEGLLHIRRDMSLAMDIADLMHCQRYFRDIAERNPTETELRVLDTYWSDHCRHTTFLTRFEEINIEGQDYREVIESSYNVYRDIKKKIKQEDRPQTLMDIATIGMKFLKQEGFLDNLDESPEINACTIKIKVNTSSGDEDWLLLFKNETHNHPTEIEPFGGAATCLGGAIRDPLSGRAYVYQAMRVTGAGDPRTPVEETLPGKLPQIKITREAAHGYSSYGNQIGLATGQVTEIYHPGYVAKRMEIGAVIGAVRAECVRREEPAAGDLVILLGGRTGRDGIGGATGSSLAHDEKAIEKAGAEVQKGNPPEERKIQRLFRNPELLSLIKRCNDMGAGGVSVAIGEIAESLDIFLDRVPKKYAGLNATEIALSESQERMAVVVEAKDADRFIELASEENLEATVVAEVTDSGFLRMFWKAKKVVDIKRSFLDTNGASKNTLVTISTPDKKECPLHDDFLCKNVDDPNIIDKLKEYFSSLGNASQKGLNQMFDSSIGAGSVLLPYGGIFQDTPVDAMAALIPALENEANTASLMAYGYNPYLSEWSPFHGAFHAVVESVCRLVAAGGRWRETRLSLQEYFPKPGNDDKRWGLPAAALLGALSAQLALKIPAIGGKDSMSGSFNDMDVPPTLVSFAVSTQEKDFIISPEIKKRSSKLYLIQTPLDDNDLPDISVLTENMDFIQKHIEKAHIISATAIRHDGLAGALLRMMAGNRIGCILLPENKNSSVLCPSYGSFLVEVPVDAPHSHFENHPNTACVAITEGNSLVIGRMSVPVEELVSSWKAPLEGIFPSIHKEKKETEKIEARLYNSGSSSSKTKVARPRVLIPVFPGTNCEYDTEYAFKKAGAETRVLVFKNLTASQIEASLDELAKALSSSQILVIPGGFSAGDEPEGSGKFIATVFRNAVVRKALEDMLDKRDGLILGICNGFQALIKLGLVPYGYIRDLEDDSPTLTTNKIGSHVARYVNTRIVSNLSPWFLEEELGAVHTVPVSHTEGRFVADRAMAEELFARGQVATQYVDAEGNPTMDARFNPNGSVLAIEGITSPDGRVLGKMAHSERLRPGIARNIPGHKEENIFASGVKYFL